jgi:leucyl aminopeptidase (aminopeptidase T)
MSTTMTEPADVCVRQLDVTAGEKVAVLHNVPQRPIAEAIADAARRCGAEVQVVEFEAMVRAGMEPPEDVARLIAWADVGFGVTNVSLSHTRARIDACRRGMRFASMPTINEDIFLRSMPVDYGYMTSVGRALAERLTVADTVRLTSPEGTNVTLSIARRGGRNDDGDLRAPGAFGNLPAGEGYIAPVEDAGAGTIVFDGSIYGYGLLDEPLTVIIEDGRLVDARGKAAGAILALLDAAGPSGRHVAELGIGTNPAATITGVILEDEKVLGTAHIAFGTSTGVGGVNQSTVHMDGVIRAPRLEIGDEVVLDSGRLLIGTDD